MKIDKLKEQIGWLKITFGLSLATDISLVAWIFNNYSSVAMIKLVIALFATVLVTSIVFLSNKKASKKMNELEEL